MRQDSGGWPAGAASASDGRRAALPVVAGAEVVGLLLHCWRLLVSQIHQE